MKIDARVQLMPNHLPGGAVSAFSRVEMVPTPHGRVVLVGTDAEDHLTVWLSAAEGYTRWTQVPWVLEDGERPRVLDFDIVTSDDGHRFDLAVVALGEPGPLAYVFHDVPANADPEAWTRRLAAASPAPLPFAPVGARWSRSDGRPSEPRALAAWGTTDSDRPGAWWVSFDAGGLPRAQGMFVPDRVESADDLQLMTANQRLDGELVSGCFMVSPGSDAEHRSVIYVVPWSTSSPEQVLPQRFVDGTYDGWGPVSDMCGAPWPDGVTIAYFNVTSGPGDGSTVCFFNDTAAIEGLPAAVATSSLRDYRPVPGPVHADIEIVRGHPVDHRYELVSTARGDDETRLLRLSAGSEASDRLTPSTLLAADVATFCACLCVDQLTLESTPHVLVSYQSGGVDLFSLDRSTGLWHRFVLADDRLDDYHDVSSYTVRALALEDDGTPVGRGALGILALTPCTAVVQGRVVHMSPTIPVAVALGPGSDVNIVLSQGTLASSRLVLALYPDVDVEAAAGLPLLPVSKLTPFQPSAEKVLLPSDLPMDTLAALPDSQAIRDAVASDGSQPFKHLSPATCDAAYVGIGALVTGYRSVSDGTSRTDRHVVRRLRFEGRAGAVICTVMDVDSPLPEPLQAVPRAPDDPLDRFGNLMAYLWTEGRGAVEFYLNQLADGMLEIVVRVGDELVSLVVQSEQAVAECTDWFLQHTLGVDLAEVVNWLGFVFDWEAVLLNKDALGAVLDLVVKLLREQLADAGTTANAALEFLRANLDAFPDLSDEVRKILDQPAQQRPPGESHLERAGADPSAQWGLQTLQSYGGATGMSTDQSFDFVAVIQNALLDAGEELEDVIERLVAFIESGAVTGQPVLQIVEATLLIVGDGVIDIAEKVVGDLVAVLLPLFDALVAVADERIDVPVLTALYENRIVPGGTLTIRDAVLLAASLLMTVGHKLAFHTDLFSEAQLDAIYASDSLPALVHKLEAAPVAANAPRMPVGGLVGVLASTFKSAYVYYWFQDTWYDYAPDEVKLMDLNFPKAACDAMAWGTSTAWSCYRVSVAGEKESFAAVANSLLLVSSFFNRVKDGVELFHIYADKNPARELTEVLRNWEATAAGAAVLVGDALFAVGLATIPNPDCPEDLWNSMIAMPVIAWADSAVYSLLALEYRITDPARRLQVRQARTVLNVLRPVLGFANATLKIGAGAAGYSYPGSATD